MTSPDLPRAGAADVFSSEHILLPVSQSVMLPRSSSLPRAPSFQAEVAAKVEAASPLTREDSCEEQVDKPRAGF